jgi:hypothetical protein
MCIVFARVQANLKSPERIASGIRKCLFPALKCAWPGGSAYWALKGGRVDYITAQCNKEVAQTTAGGGGGAPFSMILCSFCLIGGTKDEMEQTHNEEEMIIKMLRNKK